MNYYKFTDISFCIHSIEDVEGEIVNEDPYKGLNLITFCPVNYWEKHKCLPDFFFGDQFPINHHTNEYLPEGYSWYTCVEECQWASKKSKEEITKQLISMGFVENLEMEKFLSDCWG